MLLIIDTKKDEKEFSLKEIEFLNKTTDTNF
jgi:hypothetical protein